MGVLAGAEGPTGIARWAVAKKDLLQQGLNLPNGIPSRDVSLLQQVMNYVDEHISDDFEGVPSQRLEEDTKKAHGRSDLRINLPFEVPNAFTGTSSWKNLKTIGVVVHTSVVKGEQ
jgi:hypothetical protein